MFDDWVLNTPLLPVNNKEIIYGKLKTLWPLFNPLLNCLKGTKPLQGDSLLFTTQSLGVPGTHLIDLGRVKDWVNLTATQRF